LWKEIEDMDVAFSFLYSDLGRQFYTDFGWTARISNEMFLPPSMMLPASTPASMDDSATVPTTDGMKKATRASHMPVILEPVADDASLQVLINHDAQLLRETMKQQLRDATGSNTGRTLVAVTPEIRCIQWFHERAWFNATNIWKLDPTMIKEGLHYGVRVSSSSGSGTAQDSFVLWHHDFTDNALMILRWRNDPTEESDAIALALAKATQDEARKWKLPKIIFWSPDPALAKLLGLEIKERTHSIPSLGLVKPLQDEQNIDWILNEKYSWYVDLH
jgi:hypothetical protein